MTSMIIYKNLLDNLNSHILQFCTFTLWEKQPLTTAIIGTALLFRFTDTV